MNRRKKNRKIIIIAILVTMVVGLSLGFAVFSNNLIIKSSATVNSDPSTFLVKFSNNSTSASTGNVVGVQSGGATAGTASLNATQISNVTATFKKPGQSVTYTFYARNDGQFDAYLESITFANATGSNPIKCDAKTGTTANLVTEACKGMKVTVTVGDTSPKITATNASNSDIDGHKLLKNGHETVVVKIEYTGTAVADGDFTVTIGDITLNYSSQDL